MRPSRLASVVSVLCVFGWGCDTEVEVDPNGAWGPPTAIGDRSGEKGRNARVAVNGAGDAFVICIERAHGNTVMLYAIRRETKTIEPIACERGCRSPAVTASYCAYWRTRSA